MQIIYKGKGTKNNTKIIIAWLYIKGSFYFKAVTELFGKMRQHDDTLRVIQNKTKDVLWDENKPLPENKDFTDKFHLREQTFRKGNKKISLYCIIESRFSMNKLKYTDPLRQYIFDRNIWIKPDLYLTKTV